MSDSLILTPVTKELLDWGRKCDVPIPVDTPDGRRPTDAEIEGVLKSLDDCTYSLRGTGVDLSGQVDSIETMEWEYQSDNSVMNKAFGGPHTGPKEWVALESFATKNQERALSFNGHGGLIIRIAQGLARDCGPLAVFASSDGTPTFFLPDAEEPIWDEPWG